MKTNTELVGFCKSKLGTPYVFGTKGERLTGNRLNELCHQYPRIFTEQYRQRAERFIGHECADCSGLISWCTGIVRGSSEYRETAVAEKNIHELNESMIGWALWKCGHIGIYIGNGYCIEARGIGCGTIKALVSSNSWKKVLKLRDIEYRKIPNPVEPDPSRKLKQLIILFLEWLLRVLKKEDRR